MKKIINTVKARYYHNSIRTNLFTIFFLLFALITLPSIVLLSVYQHRVNQSQIKDISDSSLAVSYNNLNQTINGAKKISTSMLSNDIIQGFFKSDRTSNDSIIAVENSMHSICSTSATQLSSYLYDFDGNCYYIDYSNKKRLNTAGIEELPIYSELIELDGATLCTNAQNIYANATGLSVIRIIKNINTLSNMGVLVINIPQEALNQAFSESLDRDTQGFILDESYRNILDTPLDTLAAYEAIAEDNQLSNSFFYRAKGQNHLLSYRLAQDYGLIIGTLRVTQPYSMAASTTRGGMVILLILNILFLWGGIVTVSRSVTKPIISISGKMNAISEKNFRKINTDFTNENEIGHLVRCYNEMVDKIQNLLAKELATERHRRHLELNLLQTQIKPHFLYNTIDHARMLSITGEVDKAVKLMHSMGTYYKTILSKGETTITIADEINTIRQYELILSVEEDLNYEIKYQVDESIKQKQILKFILQPLIENCIKHGLYGVDNGMITIAISIDNMDNLFLSVSDNGRGMKPELITGILKQSHHSPSKSFGLAATLERLQLYYGDDCRIMIENIDPGTKITIRVKNFSNYW